MKSKLPIRVIIADDHALFRRGVADAIKTTDYIILVGESENGKDVIELIEKKLPDVIIIDVDMPLLNGTDAARIISERFPRIPIIAVTGHGNSAITAMFEVGVMGYVMKHADPDELIAAIESVYNGKEYRCEHTLRSTGGKPIPKCNLTKRELEVLTLLCQGNSNHYIAQQLMLEVRTVEGYRANMMRKIGAKHAADAMKYAMRHGIVEM